LAAAIPFFSKSWLAASFISQRPPPQNWVPPWSLLIAHCITIRKSKFKTQINTLEPQD
jgi:hypothetical protein